MTSPKVVVFGATGKVGSGIVSQLVARGCNLRIAVRNPDNYKKSCTFTPLPEIVKADITDSNSVVSAIAGCDAVVVAIAASKLPREYTTFWSDASTVMKTAMQQTGIRRVFAISACGAVDDSEESCCMRCIGRSILKVLYMFSFDD